MTYIHAIAAGDLQWVLYAVSLLVGVLQDELLLLIRRRGFGRGESVFWQKARIVRGVEDPVGGAVHHRARAERARGADRLRRIQLLQQSTRAMKRPLMEALGE
jgi:hypothetical protein